MDVKSACILTWHQVGHASRSLRDIFKKPSLGGRLDVKSGDQCTLKSPMSTFFGLSQVYGHGYWLTCEVGLSIR
jgi:hypothetical protein